MPAIIALVFRLLASFLPAMGWSLLRGLGFAAVSYVGVSAGMDFAKGYVMSKLTSISPAWLEIAGLLQIDVCINILFSAYIARAMLWGINKSGSKKSINFQGK